MVHGLDVSSPQSAGIYRITRNSGMVVVSIIEVHGWILRALSLSIPQTT